MTNVNHERRVIPIMVIRCVGSYPVYLFYLVVNGDARSIRRGRVGGVGVGGALEDSAGG